MRAVGHHNSMHITTRLPIRSFTILSGLVLLTLAFITFTNLISMPSEGIGWLYFVSGLVVLAAIKESWARIGCITMGAVYILLALTGTFYGNLFGLVDVTWAANMLHLVFAFAFLGFGFGVFHTKEDTLIQYDRI